MPLINSDIVAPHWIVADKPVYNQITAWQQIVASKQSYRFYFHENQYDKLDWTQEPGQSWDDLVRTKLIMLREKYKKLSLFYSAGRDSHMILRYFYETGIHLDQLIVKHIPTVNDRVYELENYILPKIGEFRKKYPKTEVKFITVNEQSFNQYFTEDWIYRPYQNLRMSLFFPIDFGNYIKTQLDPDPSNGYIVGVDKPRLLIEDNKIYSLIIDKTVDPFLTDLPNLELFFFSPDFPELHLKQSWMMLRYLETHFGNQLTPEFVDKFCNTGANPLLYDHLCHSCGRGPAFDLNLAIQNGNSKVKSTGKDHRYTGFAQDAVDNYKWKSAKVWFDTVNQVTNALPQDIFKNGKVVEGITGIQSKKYFMKDLATNA
jgi:hypothetical protein